MMEEPLKILFIASEAYPFAKTGGLADVGGALTGALKQLGADVRVVMPFYETVRKGGFECSRLIEKMEVPLGSRRLAADVYQTHSEAGVPVYLIRREDFYDRPNLYGPPGDEYYDNLERFSYLAHAAIQVGRNLSFRPDVVHCHDWQTGLVAPLLKGPYGDLFEFRNVPIVFTIHNLRFQGRFPKEKLPVTGLPEKQFFHSDGVEFWGDVSLLKAGIVYSDAVTTVSPTYAYEIQNTEFGEGMDGVLRSRHEDLFGILNGVDYRTWNPETDTHLPAHFTPDDLTGKERCKSYLVNELGLNSAMVERPLLGVVSRLDKQKGFDLLCRILDDPSLERCGFAILGSGESSIQSELANAAKVHRGRVALRLGYDEPLAHRIIAGSDMLLIPSLYEPCGLTQMYGLKYGTVPVVRATGGLEDTVEAYDPVSGEGCGFKFGPHVPSAFLTALQQALQAFEQPSVWRGIVRNGMKKDFSWEKPARQYMDLYSKLTRRLKKDRSDGGTQLSGMKPSL